MSAPKLVITVDKFGSSVRLIRAGYIRPGLRRRLRLALPLIWLLAWLLDCEVEKTVRCDGEDGCCG